MPSPIAPFALERSVFQSYPSRCAVALEVRRIEYYERKRVIWEWQIGEVRQVVGINYQFSASAFAGNVGQRVPFAALIHKDRPGIFSVKPKHPAATTGIQCGREDQPCGQVGTLCFPLVFKFFRKKMVLFFLFHIGR
jgi:hypothetical protein